MKDLITTKPGNMKCDGLWELYSMLGALEKPYLKYRKGKEEKIGYIDGMDLIIEETKYGFDDRIGTEVPYCKPEVLKIRLKRIENYQQVTDVYRIEVEAFFCGRLNAGEFLERENISIPTDEEIGSLELQDGLPVSFCEVHAKSIGLTGKQRRCLDFVKWIASDVKSKNIPYRIGMDEGSVRYTMALSAPNSPDGYVECCIWFFETEAEVRVYYTQTGADICRMSEYRHELLRFLNYVNARVFPNQRDGRYGLYDPQVFFMPRFYITEDESFDISATTIMNYEIMERFLYQGSDYITSYCLEFLDILAPYIFGILNGELSAAEAITEFESRHEK